MFDLVILRHGITHDSNTLDLTCVAVPPLQRVLTEPHSAEVKLARNKIDVNS